MRNKNEEFLNAIRNSEFTVYVPVPTDYESSPEAIRQAQLNDVAEAAVSLGEFTPEQISEITCLPLWNVRRCLAALGLPSGSESGPYSRTRPPQSRPPSLSRRSRLTA